MPSPHPALSQGSSPPRSSRSAPQPASHQPASYGSLAGPTKSSSSSTSAGASGYFFNPSHPSHPSSPEPRRTVLRSNTGLSARHGKGLTFEEAHAGGIIGAIERSKEEFEGVPITDDEIKRLPRKLRGYYTRLAVLHAHYTEVDSILSGTLPQNIALSFSPGRTYVQRLGDLEEEVASPGWGGRRASSWRIAPAENGNGNGNGHGHAGEDGEEAGESTALMGIEEREAQREKIARLALHVNTIVNVLLVAGKVIAVLYSSSISLTASLVDSALDLLSTFIILGTSWAIGIQSDKHMYPAGKRRFEPLGVLVFSVAMIASFVQVFIESFQRATGPAEEEAVSIGPIGLGIMLATIGVKGVLWVWCSNIPSSGVQALAQDAENDVLLNIMSLSFPWVGSLVHWRLLDPIGGMVLSLYIIIEWIKTLLSNFANLSGKSASSDQITRVLYLVSRFNPVLEIADVECYHIGDDLIVEVDVILPRSSSLHYAHDVGETIQCVLESLDGVIRAYVHCDYSSFNPLQHTNRAPQPYPITRFQTSTSSSDSGSATPTPKPPVHSLGLQGMTPEGMGGVEEEAVDVVGEPEEMGGKGGAA
ncbi:hypothetical protein IAT38_006548 [Cryptococcus sp. DSM 104549]